MEEAFLVLGPGRLLPISAIGRLGLRVAGRDLTPLPAGSIPRRIHVDNVLGGGGSLWWVDGDNPGSRLGPGPPSHQAADLDIDQLSNYLDFWTPCGRAPAPISGSVGQWVRR